MKPKPTEDWREARKRLGALARFVMWPDEMTVTRQAHRPVAVAGDPRVHSAAFYSIEHQTRCGKVRDSGTKDGGTSISVIDQLL